MTDTDLTCEQAIRDAAANVINRARNRVDHPSFGNTKGSIREAAARMEGMIGLYMILTGQAMHASVPELAQFQDSDTTQRVVQARNATKEI
jgi:hypothetical protein